MSMFDSPIPPSYDRLFNLGRYCPQPSSFQNTALRVAPLAECTLRDSSSSSPPKMIEKNREPLVIVELITPRPAFPSPPPPSDHPYIRCSWYKASAFAPPSGASSVYASAPAAFSESVSEAPVTQHAHQAPIIKHISSKKDISGSKKKSPDYEARKTRWKKNEERGGGKVSRKIQLVAKNMASSLKDVYSLNDDPRVNEQMISVQLFEKMKKYYLTGIPVSRRTLAGEINRINHADYLTFGHLSSYISYCGYQVAELSFDGKKILKIEKRTH